MTIEQLLDLPPEGLEALTDSQLVEMLGKYFAVTRPKSDIKVLTPQSVGRKPATGGSSLPRLSQRTLLDRILSDPNMTPEKLKTMKELMK